MRKRKQSKSKNRFNKNFVSHLLFVLVQGMGFEPPTAGDIANSAFFCASIPFFLFCDKNEPTLSQQNYVC
jgi:hypothetical protein